MKITRDYQDKPILDAAVFMKDGHRSIIFQAPTGFGKTVAMSVIANGFVTKSKAKVLILVHREELADQTRKALQRHFGINAQMIEAKTKQVYERDVYIGMVETVFGRVSKNEFYLPKFGLVVVDEAHRGEYKKIYSLFHQERTIGFTATPISAKKNEPLKDNYSEIVTSIQISELIKIWEDDPLRGMGLVQNHTYGPKGIDKSAFRVKGGEYDKKDTNAEYTKTVNIQNTVKKYKEKADGTKAIVFNSSVAHSKLVTQAFIDAGYHARHCDADNGKKIGADGLTWRESCLLWLKNTPGAILNNVDLFTTGFDESSVRCVIMNRSTLSLTLWIQCTGRGSRPDGESKPFFIILDMGGNARIHGDWNTDRDWRDLFHNPAKPREKLGVAPIKECPECEYINSASARVCKECGFVFPVKAKNIDTDFDLELVTKGIRVSNIDPAAMVRQNADKKEFYTFYKIGGNIAAQAKRKFPEPTEKIADAVTDIFKEKAKEWAKEIGKEWADYLDRMCKEFIYKNLFGN